MKFNFSSPRQVDENTVKTGAAISYCFFEADKLRVYLDGGSSNETILLEGLSNNDKKAVEDFLALLVALTKDEVENSTTKEKVRVDFEAGLVASEEIIKPINED